MSRYLSDMLIGLLRNEAALMLLTGKAGESTCLTGTDDSVKLASGAGHQTGHGCR